MGDAGNGGRASRRRAGADSLGVHAGAVEPLRQRRAASEAEVAARLFETRTLVRLWGQRRTLHLYASEDWPLLQAAFRERQTVVGKGRRGGSRRSISSVTVPASSVRAELLRERGTLSRKDLRKPTSFAGRALFSRGAGCSPNSSASASPAMRAGTAARRATPPANTGCLTSPGPPRPSKRRTSIWRDDISAVTARRRSPISSTGGGVTRRKAAAGRALWRMNSRR